MTKSILLIHGYSSEGKDNTVQDIYGTLPERIEDALGGSTVVELDLSRWISLDDGVAIDDISFAMDRALTSEYPNLLESGFHVVIHSTGALVVRNWIKNYSPKPCPIDNLVHLAGANFGSGLAHLGRGQLARWGRYIFAGTQPGEQVLNALEFGAWNTLDLHLHFLKPGNDMLLNYQVREFCLIGSQVFAGALRKTIELMPLRYPKEDSSDNTVRTAAGNLNVNYVVVQPNDSCMALDCDALNSLVESREQNIPLKNSYYDIDYFLASERSEVPYSIIWETAHFGEDIGIVDGKKSRSKVTPLVAKALQVTDDQGYHRVVRSFSDNLGKTMQRAADAKHSFVKSWTKQSQYEGHSQLIFRVRDQFGDSVDSHDITFLSKPKKGQLAIERLIEDRHANGEHPGTVTFYLRVMQIGRGKVASLLDKVAGVELEITGYEPKTSNIAYVPLVVKLSAAEVRAVIQPYRTTILDITLARLPSDNVFAISPN